MQAKILILCGQCNHALESINIDTADMQYELQNKINKPILAHRKDCEYYKPSQKCEPKEINPYYEDKLRGIEPILDESGFGSGAGLPVDPPCSKLGG